MREEGKTIYICSCLTRELLKFIDYRIMLKFQCKTTFNSTYVGKKNHQNRTRVDFEIMFYKNVVLYEVYSKILVTEYFLHVSVHVTHFIRSPTL
jgi:hypothetical protein